MAQHIGDSTILRSFTAYHDGFFDRFLVSSLTDPQVASSDLQCAIRVDSSGRARGRYILGDCLEADIAYADSCSY